MLQAICEEVGDEGSFQQGEDVQNSALKVYSLAPSSAEARPVLALPDVASLSHFPGRSHDPTRINNCLPLLTLV